jgi:indolepyruvate ferredoxin oxidoreductase beta subunit
MKQPLNFLLSGVGGQGTILASDVLVRVGLVAGYDVKQAEVHGMAQRGGNVTSHVRWGERVYAPLVGAGEVDVLLAFEKLEALRNLSSLRQNGLALINLEAIIPITVTSLGQHYPEDDLLRAAVAQVTPYAAFVDGPGIARELRQPRVANSVLIGALARLLEFHGLVGPELADEVWLEVLCGRVPPATVDLNREAFLAGRSAALAPTREGPRVLT